MTLVEISVAKAAPRTPSLGKLRCPKISSQSRTMFNSDVPTFTHITTAVRLRHVKNAERTVEASVGIATGQRTEKKATSSA